MMQTKRCNRLDDFLMKKMLNSEKKHFSDDECYQAYRKFLKLTTKDGKRIAATQTIKKWFGIGGIKRPNREGLFKIGFDLRLSVKEMEELFVYVMREPDFQINDYREMIFLYGFYHQMTYDDCIKMIDCFEKSLPGDLSIRQHNCTNDIWEEYGKNCELDADDFLQWMLEKSEDFKGYSKTVLDYFRTIKEEIISEIKMDAKDYLETLLAETSFEFWEEKWHMNPENRKKTIPRYLNGKYCKKNDNLSKQIKETIFELVEISNISLNSNTELLAEMYTDLKQRMKLDNKRRVRSEVRLMDDKYLSDLLNVGVQKEKLMKLIVTPNLENRDKLIKEQQRRCSLITRQDILPLILCLSQKRYARRMESENYDAKKAKKESVDFANHILNACKMAPVEEEKYELDGVLCGCFQKDEMYSLADVLEQYLDAENGDDE